MYLPDRDSDPLHSKHARFLSEQLAIPLQVIDLSPMLRSLGVYRQLPLVGFLDIPRQCLRIIKTSLAHSDPPPGIRKPDSPGRRGSKTLRVDDGDVFKIGL